MRNKQIKEKRMGWKQWFFFLGGRCRWK